MEITEIKAEGPISFKSAESIANSHEFKTIHQVYNNKFFHCTTFLPAFAFFLWDFPRANNIKKQSNIAMSLIKPVIECFSFRKTDRLDCEIACKKT